MRVTYVTQSDLKGWIPSWGITFATSKVCICICYLYLYFVFVFVFVFLSLFQAAPSMMRTLKASAMKYQDFIKENELERFF